MASRYIRGLWVWMGALGVMAASAAVGRGADAQIQGDVTVMEGELAAARGRVGELEKVFYEKYPLAKEAEGRIGELRKLEREGPSTQGAGFDVLRGDAGGREKYETVRGAWTMVALAEGLKRSTEATVMKALMTGSAELLEKLAGDLRAAKLEPAKGAWKDADVVWEAWVRAIEEREPGFEKEFAARVEQAGLPAEVVAAAKREEEVQGELEVMQEYVGMVIPKELVAARKRVVELEGRVMRVRDGVEP